MSKKSCNYLFFTKVSDRTPLGRLFNEVFGVLNIPRGASAPDTTTDNGWMNSEQALVFYEMCLLEKYLHSIIDNLSEWLSLTKKYANEFQYSWKYFAISHRIDLINEFGGDENDYNDDGSIRTDFTDEELIDYTIVTELANPNFRSIFLSTTPVNCLNSCLMISYLGTNCIFDFLKEKTGKPIRTFRKDEHGRLVENDWMDEAMQKAENEIAHNKIADMFWSVLLNVYALLEKVKKLPKTEDNKVFFQGLPKLIDQIFNLKIPIVKLPEIDREKN